MNTGSPPTPTLIRPSHRKQLVARHSGIKVKIKLVNPTGTVASVSSSLPSTNPKHIFRSIQFPSISPPPTKIYHRSPLDIKQDVFHQPKPEFPTNLASNITSSVHPTSPSPSPNTPAVNITEYVSMLSKKTIHTRRIDVTKLQRIFEKFGLKLEPESTVNVAKLKFPLSSAKELESFETVVGNDAVRQTAISQLRRYYTPVRMLASFLTSVIEPTVLAVYNWHGGLGKKCAKDLYLFKYVIFDVANLSRDKFEIEMRRAFRNNANLFNRNKKK